MARRNEVLLQSWELPEESGEVIVIPALQALQKPGMPHASHYLFPNHQVIQEEHQVQHSKNLWVVKEPRTSNMGYQF